VVACDMPYVSAPLLARIAHSPSTASVLAARSGDRWDPLCARYDAKVVRPALDALIAAGGRSFQQLLATLAVEELTLSAAERDALRDWDTPEDVLMAARPAPK